MVWRELKFSILVKKILFAKDVGSNLTYKNQFGVYLDIFFSIFFIKILNKKTKRSEIKYLSKFYLFF
jgi:hypothetical protein